MSLDQRDDEAEQKEHIGSYREKRAARGEKWERFPRTNTRSKQRKRISRNRPPSWKSERNGRTHRARRNHGARSNWTRRAHWSGPIGTQKRRLPDKKPVVNRGSRNIVSRESSAPFRNKQIIAPAALREHICSRRFTAETKPCGNNIDTINSRNNSRVEQQLAWRRFDTRRYRIGRWRMQAKWSVCLMIQKKKEDAPFIGALAMLFLTKNRKWCFDEKIAPIATSYRNHTFRYIAMGWRCARQVPRFNSRHVGEVR